MIPALVISLIVSVILLILLILKIVLMKRSVRKIANEYQRIAGTDTNQIIDIPSRDRDLRFLTKNINDTLKDVRKSYQRYNEGDMEMKMAITNISHDLRTPLTAVCGHLDLLKKEEKSEEVSKTLDIIEDRALYMKQLTEELFEYSVIISSDEPVKKEKVLLNQVLEDTIMNYYAALAQRGIEPQVDLTEEQVIRTVNRQQMDRVFSNLMSNALKYSDGDLRISMDKEGTVVFANRAAGLDKLETEKLFNRFYTVESARNSTGLGLSIARKFVSENGGDIKADHIDGSLVITIRFA